jgi:hypothetical protein
MSVDPDVARLTVVEFRQRIHDDLVPLSRQFSYFSIAISLSEDDLRDYLQDPIAALPPSLCDLLPPVAILLVPHLERGNNGRNGKPNGRDSREKEPPSDDYVTFEKPAEGRGVGSSLWLAAEEAVIALAVQHQEVADYHYELYRQIAALAAQVVADDSLQDFRSMLREELMLRIHGEVDEGSWQLKQALQRRQTNMKRDTKGFRKYAGVAFADTMTLYLHGICCDIDVETGPRQLPSRYLRRRLRLLSGLFPPPEGYAVFPEDLDREETPPKA